MLQAWLSARQLFAYLKFRSQVCYCAVQHSFPLGCCLQGSATPLLSLNCSSFGSICAILQCCIYLLSCPLVQFIQLRLQFRYLHQMCVTTLSRECDSGCADCMSGL